MLNLLAAIGAAAVGLVIVVWCKKSLILIVDVVRVLLKLLLILLLLDVVAVVATGKRACCSSAEAIADRGGYVVGKVGEVGIVKYFKAGLVFFSDRVLADRCAA